MENYTRRIAVVSERYQRTGWGATEGRFHRDQRATTLSSTVTARVVTPNQDCGDALTELGLTQFGGAHEVTAVNRKSPFDAVPEERFL